MANSGTVSLSRQDRVYAGVMAGIILFIISTVWASTSSSIARTSDKTHENAITLTNHEARLANVEEMKHDLKEMTQTMHALSQALMDHIEWEKEQVLSGSRP